MSRRSLSMVRSLAVLYLPAVAVGAPLDGDAMLRAFFEEEVRSISARSLAGIRDRAHWECERPRLRRELLDMLGLLPEPPRGDLRAAITGTIERPDLGIAVEKLHFQSLPDLYVTANLYRPLAPGGGKVPAVLYLCGHGNVKKEGISYGSKVHYQRHPAWFARSGYVALVIDTLQLGEIEGHHHGTYRLDMWWWVTRGYTPAGVEAWNSIRALDYLASRPEVDGARIGVTGRSGGGIGTWWLAALDERPQALVPVAGITDLDDHVLSGCIEGHCDCNYLVNLYRWDYPSVAALAAPRPLLFSNTDKDRIFPLDGVLRVHSRIRDIYRLYDAGDRLGLLITEGPHKDTQELRVPAFRWMARWLEGKEDAAIERLAEPHFEPEELKVFTDLPGDEINTTIHETFVAAAPVPPVPRERACFDDLSRRLRAKLLERTFRNAPDADAPIELEETVRAERAGLLLRGYTYRSEGAFRLPLWVLSAAGGPAPATVVLEVTGEDAWTECLTRGAGVFAAELRVEAPPPDPQGAASLLDLVKELGGAVAVAPPRGIGPTLWSGDERKRNQVRRRFLVIGRTLTEARVHDARRAVRAIAAIPDLSGARLELRGRDEAAGLALYAAVFEPRVARVELWRLPASHRDGVTLLNVERVLGMPQAVALVFPREVVLRGVDRTAFDWTKRAADLFEGDGVLRFEDGAPAARP